MASNLLSALLIIGLPTAFWMAVLEAANVLFALGIGTTTRLVIGGGLLTVLSMVWCLTVLTDRHGKAGEKLERADERAEPPASTERA